MGSFSLDRAAIDQLLSMFSQALAIRATLFDAGDAELPDFDITDRSPYCSLLRRDPVMNARCLTCDRSAIAIARKRRTPYRYTCHRGLWEAVVPLFSAEGVYLGSLLCGQQRPPGARRRHDERNLATAFRALPVMSEAQFAKVVELLDYIGRSIITRGLIRQRHPDWAERLTAWVDAHLAEPISLARMAAEIGRSPSWLSQRFAGSFGTSPGRWLIERRLQQAQARLQAGAQVAEAAQAVGYCDPFHFSKAYKAWCGHPPSLDRADFSQEDAKTRSG